jgi:hypothetical protein
LQILRWSRRRERGWIKAIREALGMTTAVQERALRAARKRVALVSHMMALENQRVPEADEHAELERLAQELIDGPGSALWDEP